MLQAATAIATFTALHLHALGAPTGLAAESDDLSASNINIASRPNTWNDLSAEASVAFASRHLTYGLVDNPDPVITNSASIKWKDFAFFSETIFDTTRWGELHGGYGNRRFKYQEIDFGPEYSHTFDSTFPIEIGIGYVYAHHPHVHPGHDYENPDTQFVNLSVGLPDVFLSPTVEYELDIGIERGAMYFHIGGTYAANIADTLVVELGTGLGIGNPSRNRFDADIGRWGVKDIGVSLDMHWSPMKWLDINPCIKAYEQIDPALREAARHFIEGERRHSAQVVGSIDLIVAISGTSEQP